MEDCHMATEPSKNGKKKKREGFRGEEATMNMTPMIDVCFQLLVFFMVTSKFKTLAGRLDAFLPIDS